MVEIKTLETLDADGIKRLVTGYVAHAKYSVSKSEQAGRTTITLELVELERPFHKRYDYLDEETLRRYAPMLGQRLSVGAYDGPLLVGIALAEPQTWNNSLWVWEFHVAETHRRQGVGRRMMDSLAEKGKAAGLRIIVCETQSTNVPGIDFYRSVGFRLEGVDLSYYSNEDWPDGEVAVFMKRRLA
jgi:ribosomal protein S18 acetylase RimI-like enzyme